MPREDPQTLSAAGQELAGRLLAETREEVARADGKAQILLAAVLVVIGVTLGGVIAGDWRPSSLSAAAEWIWWAGAVLVIVGVLALGNAVRPRLLPGDIGRVTYFADVLKNPEMGGLIAALNGEAERRGRDVEQLMRLSKIAHEKYRCVVVAILALGGGVVVSALAAAFG